MVIGKSYMVIFSIFNIVRGVWVNILSSFIIQLLTAKAVN